MLTRVYAEPTAGIWLVFSDKSRSPIAICNVRDDAECNKYIAAWSEHFAEDLERNGAHYVKGEVIKWR